MKKILGWVSLGLGGFMVVAAVMATGWAADRVQKTPLDVDSVTRLDGTAARINTTEGGVDEFDVRASSFTQSDSEASDDDVVVFVNTTCLVKDVPGTPDCGEEGVDEDADPNVITVSDPFVFATDRYTAEPVNDGDYLPEDAVEVEGLVNKWPFSTARQDYPVWDGLLGRAVTATYEGEEAIDGLDTYVFNLVVEDEPAEVIAGTDGLYSQNKTYWIEPSTGTIIKQTQVEQRALEDGTVLLDLDIAFTDEQVAFNVSDTKASAGSLKLITDTVPLVGWVVGIPLMLIGVGLLLWARREGRTS